MAVVETCGVRLGNDGLPSRHQTAVAELSNSRSAATYSGIDIVCLT